MKAAVLTAPRHLSVVSVPDPECGPNDVVVGMRAVGLCGSDLAVYRGTRAVATMPWTMGHEGVGEIVAVGSAVIDRHVGQQVAVEPNYCCFSCPACVDGRTSACQNRLAVGMNHPGLLSEYAAVPAEFAWPVDDRVSLADLVCAEPMTVTYSALRRSGVRAGDDCLVIGAGSQGLFLCQALLALGAHPIVQEPHDGRRELAQALGATTVAADTCELPLLFETSGAPDVLATALRRLARHGTAVLVGLNSTPIGVSTADLVQRQLTLKGSLIYDHPTDFAATIAVLEAGRVRPSRILHRGFGFTDTAEAFAAAPSIPGKVWIEIRQR